MSKTLLLTQLIGRLEFNEATDTRVRNSATLALQHELMHALAREFS